MSTFSVNQVRQLYVVKTVVDYQSSSLPSAAGAVRMQTQGGYMWFDHYGPDGLTRSDLINLDHLKYFKAVKSSAMASTMKKELITISDSALSSSATIAGQDYILKFEFSNWGTAGIEDTYYKYATVRGNGVDTASVFYEKLYDSLVMNFAKESVPLLKFGLVGTVGGLTIYTSDPSYTFIVDDAKTATSAAAGVITIGSDGNSTADDFNADIATAGLDDIIYVSAVGSVAAVATATALTYTGLWVEELEQPWSLGSKSFHRLNYNTRCNKITLATGEEINWGTVAATTVDTTTVGNGKLICDLEWFTAGERGDIYRGVSAPYYPKTELLGEKDATYSLIELGYAFYDSGVNEFPSEKTMTFAVKDETDGTPYTAINSLINDIEAAATSFTVADLS